MASTVIGPKPLKLWCGRTSGGVNHAISVGDDGEIDGTGGTPSTPAGPRALVLACGRTGDDNVPMRVDADGKLNIDWNL
jgi:hypothetical protein